MKLISVLSLLGSIQICFSQVHVYPLGQYVSIPGGDALFRCTTDAVNTRIISVEWFVNNTNINRLNLANVTSDFDSIGNGLGVLHFHDIPRSYNMSQVRCIAVNDITGSTSESVNSTLLLLQGHLTAPQSVLVGMNGSFIIIHWRPPFSLDLTGVDPDITYCVDVLNRTSELIIHSECDIEETEFRYLTPSRIWCDWLTFIVTPVNLAGNGIKDATGYSPPSADLVIIGVTHKYTRPGVISFTINMSAPVCNARLTFTNTETEEITTLENVDISIADNNITFTTDSLTANVHYRVRVKAVNVHGPSVSKITISTHDVISTHLNIMEGVIAANYIEGSNASGALFSFLSINNSEIDFMQSVLLAVDRNNNSMPLNLHPGYYRLYVYDIEYDGTLHNGVGYPAVIEEFNTSLNSQGQPGASPFNNNCEVYTSNYSIAAICVPFTNSMATGLQIVVQLCTVRDSGPCKLYVNQSVDLHTPVIVTVERDGEYQVFIFAIREGMGILGSAQYTGVAIINDTSSVTVATLTKANIAVYIIPSVFAVLLITVAAILVTCIIVLCRKKKMSASANVS